MPTLVCFPKMINLTFADQEQDNVHIACLHTLQLFLRYRSARTAEKPYLLDMTPLSDSGHSTSAYAHKKSPHTASCAAKVCAALSGARMVVSSSQQAVMA